MARRDDELPLSPDKPVAEDVRSEIAEHIRQRTDELIAEGWTPETARAEALRVFGDLPGVERECREITQRARRGKYRAAALDAMMQDVVFAWRVLRKDRGFTLAAIVTLALGIGANTAIFSIVNGVLLRPLPYDEPGQLMTITERHANGWGNLSYANFLDLEQQSRTFSAMAAWGSGTVTVLSGAEASRANAGYVSSGFFRVFPVIPFMGRLPGPGDHQRGAAPVAVVSYDYWRNTMGAPASLDSARLRIALDHAVIGVLPPGFDFPAGNQIWRPMELLDQSMSRTSHNWNTIGRLRNGAQRVDGERDLDAILARLAPIHQPDFDAAGSIVTPLQEQLTGSLRTPLFILLGASALLLLAACTNLASSMLARGTARMQEFAVRAALGAGRLRIIRQLFTEALLLALLGAAAGIGLAFALLRLIAAQAPSALAVAGVGLDGWVLGFALMAAMVTAVLFGLFPALRLSDTSTADAMRGGRSSAGQGRLRVWHVLVVVEVGLTVVLLTGSALLMRSWHAVMSTELGFEPDSVLTVAVHLPSINYGDTSSSVARFHGRALESLGRVAGVQAVGLANVLPLEGTFPNGAMEVEGKPHDPRGPWTGSSIYRVVSGGFFAAAGIPLLQGRTFGPGDDERAPRVAIVNRAFAEREWPGENPIGKRVRPAGMDQRSREDVEPWNTVIGVVGDVRHGSMTDAYRAAYYFDHRQRPAYRSRFATYAIRASLPPAVVVPQVRQALFALDRQVPVEFAPMSDVVARTVSDRRFTLLLLSAFAAVAVLLAAVGIYGVVAYSVARRTKEIGVRLALGAPPAEVRRLVQRGAMRAVLLGLLLGAALAILVTRLLRTLLYGVSAFDPAAFAAALVVLAGTAWIASLLPARRATRVDPFTALRAE